MYTLKRKLRVMGSSYSRILETCRYERARDLLSNTEISVREIAHDLGYRHPSNFARAFVRMSGVSPLAYRNGLGSAEAIAYVNDVTVFGSDRWIEALRLAPHIESHPCCCDGVAEFI